MRVLVLARHDVRGSWFHLAAQLRRQRIADVRVVSFQTDPDRGWPTDIADVFDGGHELLHLMQHADAFHFVDLVPEDVSLFGGLVAERCNSGSVYVSMQVDERPTVMAARSLGSLAARRGWPIVTTQPCVLPGAQFLPPFVPLWRGQWRPLAQGTRPRMLGGEQVVFASSDRRIRDTPRLEALVERAEAVARAVPSVRVEVVVGRPHAQVLARRRRAHLALCGDDGLGRDGIEALAQGVATVAELSYAEHEAWSSVAGAEIPVVPPHLLEDTIGALDQAPTAEVHRRRWAEAALDPRRWFAHAAAWWSGAEGVRAA